MVKLNAAFQGGFIFSPDTHTPLKSWQLGYAKKHPSAFVCQLLLFGEKTGTLKDKKA